VSVPSSVDAVAHPHALPNGTRPPEPSAGRPPVLFLARDLAAGGAERAFVNIVNHLSGVVPYAVLLRRRGGLLGEVAPHCQLHALDRPALGGVVLDDKHATVDLGAIKLPASAPGIRIRPNANGGRPLPEADRTKGGTSR